MQSWRRMPPGKVMQTLMARRQVMAPVRFRRDLMTFTEEEFVELLKAERVSGKMIASELEIFRILKAQQDTKAIVSSRRDARRKRDVGEDLDPYVQAELRRIERLALGEEESDEEER